VTHISLSLFRPNKGSTDDPDLRVSSETTSKPFTSSLISAERFADVFFNRRGTESKPKTTKKPMQKLSPVPNQFNSPDGNPFQEFLFDNDQNESFDYSGTFGSGANLQDPFIALRHSAIQKVVGTLTKHPEPTAPVVKPR